MASKKRAAKKKGGSTGESRGPSAPSEPTFAASPGSVAAPTAGLHFDAELLARLHEHGHHLPPAPGRGREPLVQGLAVHVLHRQIGLPLAFADVDSDGDADLVSVYWGAPPSVYHNDGAGSFTDMPNSVPSSAKATSPLTAITFCIG